MADLALYTADSTGRLTFSLFPISRSRGITKLVQAIIVDLTSDFSPVLGRGAGLVSSLSMSAPSDSVDGNGIISTAVDVVRAGMLQRQQGVGLPLDERLKSLRLLSAVPSGDGWEIQIEVISAADQAVVITVPGV